jgi:hypothetical protein
MFQFFPVMNTPPATNYATLDTFSAATGQRMVLDFIGSGGSVDKVAIFEGFWPANYGGGGIDVVVDYSTDGTSVGAVEWEVSVEVIQDQDDQDAGGQDFGTATNIADTPSTATANINDRTSAGAISHANCGSPAVGDRMRFKITRDHDHATNTDDAQLHGVYITET